MDFQIIAYQDTAPIRRVGISSSPGPRALDLAGSGFVDVAEVRINGVPSPEFLVLSDSRIIAQMPVGHEDRFIGTVVVLTARYGSSGAAVVRFRQAGGRQEASGLTRLVQTYLTVLLSSRGSDIFNPTAGGGLRDIISTSAQNRSIHALVSLALSRTTDQVISMQVASRAPLSEKLAAAQLLGVRYDRRTATAAVQVRISSAAGRDVDAGLRLATQEVA